MAGLQLQDTQEHILVFHRPKKKTAKMASGFLSVVCKLLVIIALASATLFFTPGEGRYVCQAKCQDMPDCDGWCKSPGGYPKGGQCVPPLYQFCCCIE